MLQEERVLRSLDQRRSSRSACKDPRPRETGETGETANLEAQVGEVH